MVSNNYTTMKRYKLIDYKKNKEYDYSGFEWEGAWALVFLFGVILGALLF